MFISNFFSLYNFFYFSLYILKIVIIGEYTEATSIFIIENFYFKEKYSKHILERVLVVLSCNRADSNENKHVDDRNIYIGKQPINFVVQGSRLKPTLAT